MLYKSPYPWFGGKSSVIDIVWERLGAVQNVVSPFFGSGALELNNPQWSPDASLIETYNDLDGFVCIVGKSKSEHKRNTDAVLVA